MLCRKEHLTSKETYCFTNVFIWSGKRLWKGKKKCFWLNGSLVNQKWFFNGIGVKTLLAHLFLRVLMCFTWTLVFPATSMRVHMHAGIFSSTGHKYGLILWSAWSFCPAAPRPSCRPYHQSNVIGPCFTMSVLVFHRVRLWCSWISWNRSSWWIWSRYEESKPVETWNIV